MSALYNILHEDSGKQEESFTHLSNRLEVLNMLIRYLGNFQQSNLSLIIDDGTTLNISLSLVGDFHQEFSLGINHVLENVDVDSGSQVVYVRDEDVLFASGEEAVEKARVGQGVVEITVSGWVPG